MDSEDIQKKKNNLRNGMALVILICAIAGVQGETGDATRMLRLPERAEYAVTGAGVAAQSELTTLTRQRDEYLLGEFFAGNVPVRSRTMCPVSWTGVAVDQCGALSVHQVTIYAACDYLAVGSDENALRIPITPESAQKVADRLQCILPTPFIVDRIYDAATTKVAPHPFSPQVYDITAVSTWKLSSLAIDSQLADLDSTNRLIAGHKKDVVISNRLAEKHPTPRVAIYGWHLLTNKPIQPLSLVHGSSYLDYSHGIRLVSDQMMLDGETTSVKSVLMHPQFARLLSREGQMTSETITY